MLCGNLPFTGSDSSVIIEKVKKGKYTLDGDAWSSVSSSAKKLLQKLLISDPKNRLSADKALKDPWLSTVDSTEGSVSINVLKNISMLNVISIYSVQKQGTASLLYFHSEPSYKPEGKTRVNGCL
jgi:calcium-dependent protein kinase